jgi:hypothetical protein
MTPEGPEGADDARDLYQDAAIVADHELLSDSATPAGLTSRDGTTLPFLCLPASRPARLSRTPCSASMTPATPGRSGLSGRRLRPLVPRLLGPGVAQRGRAPRLGGHLPAAPAASEPAPAGRGPPERAAGELTLAVSWWRRFAFRGGAGRLPYWGRHETPADLAALQDLPDRGRSPGPPPAQHHPRAPAQRRAPVRSPLGRPPTRSGSATSAAVPGQRHPSARGGARGHRAWPGRGA